jgi:RNA polymerase sigma factor (sigma-70 family)
MLERTTVLAKNTEGRTSTGLLSFEEEQALARAVKAARAARERLAQATDLSPEERAELERLIAEGERARQRLVEANQGLVWQIARRYADAGMDVEDLVQEGNIGLLHAIEKFDPDLGYRFSTYATWWIRQAIARAVADQSRTIRLPVHAGEALMRLERAREQLTTELGREPDLAEIAERAKVDPNWARELVEAGTRPTSLDRLLGEDQETSLADLVPDASADAEAALERLATSDAVQRALAMLSERERQVLTLRYGLADGIPRTLSEVAEILGISRERVRQIEAEALRRLRREGQRQLLALAS